ncbi:phosphotransferase [Methylosinus sp. Ce-a6]|uniref:phosphotransferase n=1 Tax=Methylosinus sp. Ce-a6 TaxID=2172005 RepID=UPI001FCF1ED6|nr:phosphotransferase [Methylosinus sp. Ce-a6]
MTAHVLIVEDDEDYIAELSAIFGGLAAPSRLTVARNRDEARTLLDSEFYDFAILDLKIPTGNGTLDLDPEHGKFVFHHARKVTPGTKLLVLTSSPSDDFIADLLTQKHDSDIWGEGAKIDTVEFLRKINIDRAPITIGKVVDAIHALDGIELELRSVNLSTGEDRLVRIFARRFGAMRCRASKIGAGRSGAKTLRLQLFDGSGAPLREVVAKLGSLDRVQDEDRRYEANVVLLNGAVTPRKMSMLEFGAGPTAGLFYQLAQGHDESMFAVMAKEDKRAASAVAATSAALADWSASKAETRRTVAKVRACWVEDEAAKALQAKYGLDWAAEFEGKQLQTRWCCVHGDLHGENILVANGNKIVIIDYGDVGMSAASYDPVSLELSAVLQQNDTISTAWPNEAACRKWHDLDAYLADCPIPGFIRACREWSTAVAAGRREIAASAYTYLLRQLKYSDTDKQRILALLEGVRACMAST